MILTEANLTTAGGVLITLHRAIYFIQPACLHASRTTVCSHFRTTVLCWLTAVMLYTMSGVCFLQALWFFFLA